MNRAVILLLILTVQLFAKVGCTEYLVRRTTGDYSKWFTIFCSDSLEQKTGVYISGNDDNIDISWYENGILMYESATWKSGVWYDKSTLANEDEFPNDEQYRYKHRIDKDFRGIWYRRSYRDPLTEVTMTEANEKYETIKDAPKDKTVTGLWEKWKKRLKLDKAKIHIIEVDYRSENSASDDD